MKISEHFSIAEFECKNCDCGQKIINEKLLNMAEKIRYEIKKELQTNIKMIVHCVNRCKAKNKKLEKEVLRKIKMAEKFEVSVRERKAFVEYLKKQLPSKKSRHLKGEAIDFHIIFYDQKAKKYRRLNNEELHNICEKLQELGFIGGLGLYNWGVHADIREKKAIWGK